MIKKISVQFCYIFSFFSIFFYFLTSFYQPLIGDDIFVFYDVKNSEDFYSYFVFKYNNWTGRFLQIVLGYYIFTNEYFLIFFKLASIPTFFITIWLAWYCITSKFIKLSDENFWTFFVFSSLVWFSLPAIAENIVWVTGFITWLYPMFISLIFLTLIFYFYNSTNKNNFKIKNFTWKFIPIIITGFLSGSSIEQLSIIILFITSYIFYLIIFVNNKKISTEYYIGYLFLILGILFLFLAPGNYTRMNLVESNFIEKIFKFTIYLFSSYFFLGNVKEAMIFFFSIILLFFLFNPEIRITIKVLKKSLFWLFASLIGLFIMIPLTNFLSIRTIFFPIIFIFFFILSININLENKINNTKPLKKYFVLITISSLLFFDSFTSFLSNRSLYYENNYRNHLINEARISDQEYLEVPFYTTIPSRLTYNLNPEHDREFLKNISKIMNINIVHQASDNAALPYSKNILKEFKNILDK
ncbi:MAG: hypothetical protein CMA12_00040 [Euryarchaeota archaeon]|nr:hypothetical protein [Euryarchaeota archaeon]